MNDAVPTIDTILTQTYRHFGVPPNIIKNTEYRTPQVAYARRIATYLAKKLTFMSNKQIARELKIDPSSVSFSNTKTQREAQKDPVFMTRLIGIIDDIENTPA